MLLSLKTAKMSQAFVREQDDQWLNDIAGSIVALNNYLTKENNGIRVYVLNTRVKNGITIHEMSNGLSYKKDKDGKWEIDW